VDELVHDGAQQPRLPLVEVHGRPPCPRRSMSAA
jgi:hypothetical protein